LAVDAVAEDLSGLSLANDQPGFERALLLAQPASTTMRSATTARRANRTCMAYVSL